MGVLDTTYTFTATDVVTSTKLNNVIDQTTFTATAITGTTLALSSGQLKVNSLGITANELADGSVTAIKLASSALLPSGAVMPFAMATAPTGWFSCDGSVISRTTYALLFAAIGTTFGAGDGSNTFAIPDLRGYFVRGSGTNEDGVVSGAFGAKQSHMFENHGHAVSTSIGAVGDHTHTTPANTEPGNTNTRNIFGDATGALTNISTSPAGAHTHVISVTVNGANTNSFGAETRPYNMALLYCIKY